MRRGLAFAVDATRTIVPGRLEVDYELGAIVIALPVKLESPNDGNWGSHWARKHRASVAWETHIKLEMARFAGADTISGWHPHYLAALLLPPVTGRRRVAIGRQAPSRRNFLKDADNGAIAQKPLLDALTRLGFIVDDKERWIDLAPLGQRVSDDGRYWTDIEVTVPLGDPVPARQPERSPAHP